MSCEWPSAASVSWSFQATGAAAPKTPSLPQSAPLARTWLMRARTAARKSGRLQVEPTVAAGLDAGVLAAGASPVGPPAGTAESPPPPHDASKAQSTLAIAPRCARQSCEEKLIGRG